MRVSTIAGAACAVLMPFGALAGQVTVLVAGVADARTGQPLRDAEVVLPELHRIAPTNWLGEARIADVPAGRHRIRVRRLAYATADVELLFEGDSIGPVFMLEALPRQLDTVRVSAAATPHGCSRSRAAGAWGSGASSLTRSS